jgi:glycosyltransferase involved in cell wall biosynthesis
VTEPALVIGLPLYGRGEHLEEALESLLGQTRDDLAIVVSDDAADPEARAVLERFHDPRLRYHCNQRRLGLVGNWHRAFELARHEHPGMRYFAWASDHDAWHPRWAERLLGLMEAEPGAVLAFPRYYRVDRAGWTLRTNTWTFDTAGVESRPKRVRMAVRGMSAGNMVYGVYRVEALERAGVFRHSLLPDRLLISELSVQGHLRQVPERLFYRRVTEAPSLERQRAAFWPEGAPRWSGTPWAVQHIVLFTRALWRNAEALGVPAGERVSIVSAHMRASIATNLRSSVGRLYYEKLMRRRSLKKMAVHSVGRAVEWLQRRPWGEAVLRLGRRALSR